jgi:uncharacterized protein (TIGR03083 family)
MSHHLGGLMATSTMTSFGAYRDSAAKLQAAFAQPGVLQRIYRGPLGEATDAERLQIRLYDLLAHGWDLARATGQPAAPPDDVAEQSLAFVRGQLAEQARPGRFGPAQRFADPAIERLVGFLGRRSTQIPDWPVGAPGGEPSGTELTAPGDLQLRIVLREAPLLPAARSSRVLRGCPMTAPAPDGLRLGGRPVSAGPAEYR